MGLDMYAYSVPARLSKGKETDYQIPEPEKSAEGNFLYPFQYADGVREFHYWRKHPDLHGWMERLYRLKGGQDETFNCVTVRLTSEDLDHLEQVVKAKRLPKTKGFFFGDSAWEDHVPDDLLFVTEARAEILAGNDAYYDSSW